MCIDSGDSVPKYLTNFYKVFIQSMLMYGVLDMIHNMDDVGDTGAD